MSTAFVFPVQRPSVSPSKEKKYISTYDRMGEKAERECWRGPNCSSKNFLLDPPYFSPLVSLVPDVHEAAISCLLGVFGCK